MSTSPNQLIVNVIDSDHSHNSNSYLKNVRSKHRGALKCHDVASLVHAVKYHVHEKKGEIAVLRIFGHGHEGSQAVGGGQHPNDHQKFWVEGGFGKWTSYNCDMLAPLRHHMTQKTIVQLHGCKVAEAKSNEGNLGLHLLQKLSHIWGGIRVFAGVFNQHDHNGGAFDNATYVGVYGQRVHIFTVGMLTGQVADNSVPIPKDGTVESQYSN